MSKRLYIAIGVVAFAAYLALQFYERSCDAHALQKQADQDAVSAVAVVHAEPADNEQSIELPGNVEAWFQAPIYAQVSGYVKMWYRDYGAEVKKGDVLAEISTPTLDAQTAQAKADMEAQRAKYQLAALTAKRYQAMSESNAVSVQSISVREADARSEQAQLMASESNVNNYKALLKFRTIVAPYDGVVIARNINVGDYVNKEGTLGAQDGVSNLFTVADMHRMRLFVSVPESFGALLKPGLTAKVTVPQFPEREFEAQFLTVAKGFDPGTRTAIVEFTIENDDRGLWPGSYATVHLSATLPGNALTIPATSLVFQENGTEVATVTKDQRVHFKPIVVTKIRDAQVDVGKGLSKDDAIIDSPSAALLEGDQVKVVTPAAGYKRAVSKK